MSAIVSTEKNVQASVLQWLNIIPGVYVWRRNVGMTLSEYKGKQRVVRFGHRGQADLEGIGPNGVHIEIEIKRPGQYPTPDQVHWLTVAREHGAIAFWVDSLESCVEQLRYEFVQRGLPWRKEWEIR